MLRFSISVSTADIKMLAKATAIFVPTAVPCVWRAKKITEINVKKADKGSTTVIMNKLDKTQEGQTLLGSSKIRCGEKNMHASKW